MSGLWRGVNMNRDIRVVLTCSHNYEAGEQMGPRVGDGPIKCSVCGLWGDVAAVELK